MTDSVQFRAPCDLHECAGVAWWTATRTEAGGPDSIRVLYRVDCACNTPVSGNEATRTVVEPVTASRLPEYFTRILGRRAS